jgi:ferredoxin
MMIQKNTKLGCSRIGIEIDFLPSNNTFLSYAVEKGITVFSVATKNTDIVNFLGEWLKTQEKYKEFLFLLHIKTTENIDVINEIKAKLRTSNIIVHLSEVQQVTKEIEQLLNKLHIKALNKEIRGVGLRTHIASVARSALLKNIDTIELPVNGVENGLYVSLKNLIKEKEVTPIAVKPLGDGDLFIDTYPPDLLFNSVYSLIGEDGLVLFPLSCKEEVDEILFYFNSYMEGIHPIIEDFCNKCQKCEDVCMNKYPLALYIKYCRDMDSFNASIAEWSKNKLKEEHVHFDCISCNLCEQNCPLRVPIKKFITDHLSIF